MSEVERGEWALVLSEFRSFVQACFVPPAPRPRLRHGASAPALIMPYPHLSSVGGAPSFCDARASRGGRRGRRPPRPAGGGGSTAAATARAGGACACACAFAMHAHCARTAHALCTAHALRTHYTYTAHALYARCASAEQVEPQAALLKGSTAMARVQPLTPLTLHEAVLVGTQARTHAAPGRCAAPDWGPNEIPPYSPVLE